MRFGQALSMMVLMAFGAALTSCNLVEADETAQQAGGPPSGGPPPPPPHIMRAEMVQGDRLSTPMEGEALYSNKCGTCHFDWGMGTNLIAKQQVALGNPPTMGLLTNRDDLTADYVKAVARMGKGAMPRQTRVDITDSELEKVASYLGKGK